MASIRTARVLAALSALPLAVALFGDVAVAGSGVDADNGSNAANAGILGSGVGGDNSGNASTSQQQAVGSGASNENNTAQVNRSGFTAVDQDNTVVSFTSIWRADGGDGRIRAAWLRGRPPGVGPVRGVQYACAAVLRCRRTGV